MTLNTQGIVTQKELLAFSMCPCRWQQTKYRLLHFTFYAPNYCASIHRFAHK